MRLPIETKCLSRRATALAAALFILGCSSDNPVTPPTDSKPLLTLGNGLVSDRYTGEVWVRGNVAYTTTWGSR